MDNQFEIDDEIILNSCLTSKSAKLLHELDISKFYLDFENFGTLLHILTTTKIYTKLCFINFRCLLKKTSVGNLDGNH